jgi:hypothetical protein
LPVIKPAVDTNGYIMNAIINNEYAPEKKEWFNDSMLSYGNVLRHSRACPGCNAPGIETGYRAELAKQQAVKSKQGQD